MDGMLLDESDIKADWRMVSGIINKLEKKRKKIYSYRLSDLMKFLWGRSLNSVGNC